MRVFAQQTKPIYYDKLLRISLKAIYKKKWPLKIGSRQQFVQTIIDRFH